MKAGDLGRDVVLENVCGCLDEIPDFPSQYPALYTHSFATRLASLKPCKCYVHDQCRTKESATSASRYLSRHASSTHTVEQGLQASEVQRPHPAISLQMLLQLTVEQGLQACEMQHPHPVISLDMLLQPTVEQGLADKLA
jgi:hypothetical protein